MGKRVFLCIIDSLHPGVLEQCLSEGTVPNLDYLRRNGLYYCDCVSVFPTMTPTATATIITGTQVEQHGVPGFIWYNYQEELWENYGATFEAIMKQGLGRTLNNWFYRLNHSHLSQGVLTMHEHLSQNGMTSANINFFMRRGLEEYGPEFPPLLNLLAGNFAHGKKIRGPERLVLGKMVYPKEAELPPFKLCTPWKRYGVNDAFTAASCINLMEKGDLADLTLLYFPDNDHFSHKFGPWATSKIIRQLDGYIGQILMAFGSKEEALQQAVFIIMGDHAQTPVFKGKKAIIDLEFLLSPYRLMRIRDRNSKDRDVVISPNERMAYVDILHERVELKPELISRLAKDPRISQVMWREGSTYFAQSSGTGKRVAFSQGETYLDNFDGRWDYAGELEVLGGILKGNRIDFTSYPDAFNRIKHALDARPETCIILSAEPGFEFGGEAAATHPGGGSHGSLHYEDSLVPLIIAGTDREFTTLRVDNILSYVLDVLSC